MVISEQCTSSMDNKINKKTFHLLKRTLTTSGAAMLFCLIAMQQSVSDSESAPNTVTKCYEALCNARLMQLVPVLHVAYLNGQ